ncbi:MAG: contractile injection system tape measure protein, partial [Prolixibacteraceae bacterium]
LNEQIKNEAESLLEAAIKNWPALKNTSPDGLRQNFLQRDGKLIKKEENYRLLIERKTQDILLDKLNWNISVVKLPWMKNLLHVEW